MNIIMPPQVEFIINRLTSQGHEAYIVGGCVRDSILGLEPNDWDVATSALPDKINLAFQGYKRIQTGVKHGTISVLIDHMPIEVTTYRIDGEYSDNRHPDAVCFTLNLKEDLARRDFTINALAYNQSNGMIDCFGGAQDIIAKRIRCVGEPDLRFHEDGLRILRALRFSAVLGFTIEDKSSQSILKNFGLLDNIARERIQNEFSKLLCGRNIKAVLMDYREVIGQFIPEINAMVGFMQHNNHHIYDVWQHTLNSVESIEPGLILRMTMLLHDIGKPHCYTQDENGVGHFYGHGEKSTEMAGIILRRLKYDSNTMNTVTELVRLHDSPISPDEKSIKHRLNQLGENTLRLLLKVKAADVAAQNPIYSDRLNEINKIELMLDDVIARGQCFSVKDLQINGVDLLAIGVPEGSEIGTMLSALLNTVIEDKLTNEHGALMNQAQFMKDKENE